MTKKPKSTPVRTIDLIRTDGTPYAGRLILSREVNGSALFIVPGTVGNPGVDRISVSNWMAKCIELQREGRSTFNFKFVRLSTITLESNPFGEFFSKTGPVKGYQIEAGPVYCVCTPKGRSYFTVEDWGATSDKFRLCFFGIDEAIKLVKDGELNAFHVWRSYALAETMDDAVPPV